MAVYKKYVCECKLCGKKVNSLRKSQTTKPVGNPNYSTSDKCPASPNGKHAFIWAEEW